MNLPRSIATFCLLGSLAACGNLQSVKIAEIPANFKEKRAQLSTARPAKEDVAERAYEVPDRSMFFQQTSGGSLAIGILFGALGGLGNAMNIDRITGEMGKSGASGNLYQIDALDEASKAWSLAGALDAKDTADEVQLKPYVLLYVADEKVGITTIVSMRVESTVRAADGKQSKWAGN